MMVIKMMMKVVMMMMMVMMMMTMMRTCSLLSSGPLSAIVEGVVHSWPMHCNGRDKFDEYRWGLMMATSSSRVVSGGALLTNALQWKGTSLMMRDWWWQPPLPELCQEVQEWEAVAPCLFSSWNASPLYLLALILSSSLYPFYLMVGQSKPPKSWAGRFCQDFLVLFC